MNSPRNMKVGYILKMFPRLSETFILNEILELEAQGFDVEIFSLHPPADSRFHGQLSLLRGSVSYVANAESWGRISHSVQRQPHLLNLEPEAVGKVFMKWAQVGKSGLELFLQAASISAAVRNRGIGHVHAHFASSATVVAMLVHEIAGVSFSFTAHAKDIYQQDHDDILLETALERAAFVVTVTDFNVRHLAQRFPASAAKIRRIYNGVPVEKISVSSQAFTDAQLILAVGRLIEKKGFNYLIEACRYLRDRNRKFVCMIIGTGDQEDELRGLIGRLDLSDTVQLVGPQSQGAVAEAIARSSMMVLPCVVAKDGDRDALPTVLLEAMAAGRPVVSTTLEGVDEIVDSGRTGFLIPQHDNAGLAQAIDRLLTDSALRTEMGQAARRKAEKIFSLRENVAQLARLFGVAAATKGEPARELLPMAFR